MKTISVPTKEQLSTESQVMLDAVHTKLGKIPNLYATIAYSSSALKGMLDTEAALAHQSSFTPKEREAINLMVSQVNNCDYCLAAHTFLAKMRGFTQEDTIAIRKAAFTDAKLNTVIELAHSIATNKGEAETDVLEAFYAQGYDKKALIELISLIALRSFTNYVYTATKIPVDFPEAVKI